MDNGEFGRRLNRAGRLARETAQQHVLEALPEVLRYTIAPVDDPRGRRGPADTVKFIGGRFIKPEALVLVHASRAVHLLWVDGKVPAWVNLSVSSLDAETTHVSVTYSHDLVPADEDRLPPDAVVPKEGSLAPFRVRGPAMPSGWQSSEADGRISLLSSKG
jgi:hypothetical protein